MTMKGRKGTMIKKNLPALSPFKAEYNVSYLYWSE
jgi:hypothetical protein